MNRHVALMSGFAIAVLGLSTLPGRFDSRAPAQPAVAPARPVAVATGADTADRVRSTLTALPLHFIENRGQDDPRVAYTVRGRDVTAYFTDEGVTFRLALAAGAAGPPVRRAARIREAEAAREHYVVKLDFLGARTGVRPSGLDRTEAVLSHFVGPRERWTTGAPAYAGLVYEDLWPGIDLVYSGAAGRLKYSFHVKPGADPARIRLAYRGATGVEVNSAGELLVSTPVRGFSEARPYSYQDIGGERVEVETAYALDNAADGARPFGFRLGRYDRGRALVLDPATFVYVGFIGGSENEVAFGIAVDAVGNAYVAGTTSSSVAQFFPAQVGPELVYAGASDVWVAKVKADGSGLVYAGYLGGSNLDEGAAIAVDAGGSAYLTGRTLSEDFAGIGGVSPGGSNAFVAKVSADGTGLEYVLVFGGSSSDSGRGIAVDASGHAYVAGTTYSDDFPVTVGPGLTFNGESDGFVAKIEADGSGLVYAGYIGGASLDQAGAIDGDGAGHAYVTGSTRSDQTTFPVTVGPDLTYSGNDDAFVAKIRADGTALVYAGYIGGAAADYGHAIAVDAAGHAYVAGFTYSDQATFPVAVGPDLTHNGEADAFVAKVKADGTALVYAGYIGGASPDLGLGIAVDAAGHAYVTGSAESDETTFPVAVGPSLSLTAWKSAFVARVKLDGSGLTYAGYIGGGLDSMGFGIAVDAQGNAYVSGYTSSDETTFPVTVGPDLLHNGDRDAFVAKISGYGGAADLLATAITTPPALAKVGTSFSVTDTVQNQGLTASGASVTRYWLSLDAVKSGGDTLLTGTRNVPALAPAATSTGTVNVTIPTGTPAGVEYYLLACADHNGSVTENDEANNCRASATRVLAALPDLAVIALVNPSAPVRPGTSFTLTDTARNLGAVPSTTATTRYYLSLDTVKGAGDVLLQGTRSVPALAGGATSGPTSVTVTVPASTPQGLYNLLGCADDTNQVAEQSEANNCLASAVKVTLALPELIVSAVSNPAGPFTPGSAFTVNDTVANVSDVATGATTMVRYYLSANAVKDGSDTLLTGSRSVPSMIGGALSAGSKTVTIPATTAAGTYFLLACADDTGTVTEVSETNNCRASGTQVTVGQPDLTATVSSGPSWAVPGGAFSVTSTVSNTGTVATGVNSTVRFYLSLDSVKSASDHLLGGTRTVTSLAPGSSSQGGTNLTIPASTPLGIYRVLACADATNQVAETSETNNCGASAQTTQITQPDLTESGVAFNPASVAVGATLAVSDTVTNAGPSGAGATTTRYYLSVDTVKSANDRVLTGSRSVPAFSGAGSSTAPAGLTVTVPATVPAGSYYLIACADTPSLVAEANEINNCAASAAQLTITP